MTDPFGRNSQWCSVFCSRNQIQTELNWQKSPRYFIFTKVNVLANMTLWHHYDSRGIRNMFSMTNIRIWYRLSQSVYFCLLSSVRNRKENKNISHFASLLPPSVIIRSAQWWINTTFPRLGYLKDFVYKFSLHIRNDLWGLEVCQFWVESLNHFNLFHPQFLNRLIENFLNFIKLKEKVKYFLFSVTCERLKRGFLTR